ncbi:MAG: S9 family peptidase [Elusimicrobia bacterium]|nr:S9 family peptidase [Elusimicrobiota bacterium]
MSLSVLLAAAALTWAQPPAPDSELLSWLEKGRAPMVEWWAADSDARAAAVLEGLAGRDRLRKRLAGLMKAGSIEGIAIRGDRLFVLRRFGAEAQPKLFVQDLAARSPHLALDPGAISPDGAWALDWWAPSIDGALLAYGMTELLSGESVLRVRDVDSSLDLPDRIPRAPGSGVAWLADRTGFFYVRLPREGSVPEDELAYHARVCFHRLGTDPLHDDDVFGEGRPKEDWPEIQGSPNGRYVLVTVRQGLSRSELHVADLKGKTTDFVPVVAGRDAVFEGKIRGDTLFILTNEDAARGRIVATDLRKPFRILGRRPGAAAARRANWREIVPEGPFTITDFELADDRVVVSALERGASRLSVRDDEGEGLREVPLPAMGALRALAGRPGSGELYLLHESFFHPTTLYRYALASGALSPVASLRRGAPAGLLAADLAAFETREESFLAKDGTPVAMFLASRRGLRKDRNAPTLVLAGEASQGGATPFFAPHLLAWFEKGGLLALPNARSADDVEAAARWLVAKEYTRPQRLAVAGAGRPALLAAGAMAQAPELFRAAVLFSPLTDLLELYRMPPGLRWARDYGSPAGPEQRRGLARLSPLHRIEPGVGYPAVLVSAGEWDREIDPAHSRKLAARLMACSASGRPALFRLRADAGRRRGRPLGPVLDELTDFYGFLMWQLEMK